MALVLREESLLVTGGQDAIFDLVEQRISSRLMRRPKGKRFRLIAACPSLLLGTEHMFGDTDFQGVKWELLRKFDEGLLRSLLYGISGTDAGLKSTMYLCPDLCASRPAERVDPRDV